MESDEEFIYSDEEELNDIIHVNEGTQQADNPTLTTTANAQSAPFSQLTGDEIKKSKKSSTSKKSRSLFSMVAKREKEYVVLALVDLMDKQNSLIADVAELLTVSKVSSH